MTLIFTEGPDGSCPCQALGTFDDHPFYFRARHGDWHLNVVKRSKDPVGHWDNEFRVFEKSGLDPDDGFMSPSIAEDLIREAYAEFTAERKS